MNIEHHSRCTRSNPLEDGLPGQLLEDDRAASQAGPRRLIHTAVAVLPDEGLQRHAGGGTR
jgi:hypothetical protein